MTVFQARDTAGLKPERDSCLCEIIRADLHFDVIAWQDSNAVFPQLSSQVSNDFAVVFEFHSEVARRQTFKNLTAHFNKVFFRHNLR